MLFIKLLASSRASSVASSTGSSGTKKNVYCKICKRKMTTDEALITFPCGCTFHEKHWITGIYKGQERKCPFHVKALKIERKYYHLFMYI